MILVGRSGHAKLAQQPRAASPSAPLIDDKPGDNLPRYSPNPTPRPRSLSFRGQPPSYEDLVQGLDTLDWDAPPKYDSSLALPDVFEDEDEELVLDWAQAATSPVNTSQKRGAVGQLIARLKLRLPCWGCLRCRICNLPRFLRAKLQRE